MLASVRVKRHVSNCRLGVLLTSSVTSSCKIIYLCANLRESSMFTAHLDASTLPKFKTRYVADISSLSRGEQSKSL